MRNYRRFCAVLLLLTLLCGCAAEKAVTTASLPSETKAATETQSTSALENTGGRAEYGSEGFSLGASKARAGGDKQHHSMYGF